MTIMSEASKRVYQGLNQTERWVSYMLLKELLSDERAEGRNEGRTEGIIIGRAEDVLELLSELGEVSAELSDAIIAEKDSERLHAYLKAAAKAESFEKFRKETGL